MAKKFTFRLEPLLKLRANAVEKAKNALGIAYKNRKHNDDELHAKQAYLDEILKISANGKMPAMVLEASWQHRQFTQTEIRALEKKQVRLLEIEEFMRVELAEKMKQEKIVEKLKERKTSEYKEIVAKEEQVFLDEVASGRHSGMIRDFT